MVEVMRIMAASFKRPHAALHSVPPALQQATSNPHLCWRLLDPPGQVWVSLLWGHCSFLLGPGAHKLLFVPAKSLFPQSCVSSGGTMVGLMATSSKRAYAIHTQVYCINPTIEPPELTKDWGNRLLEGTNKSLCAPGPRRKEQ